MPVAAQTRRKPKAVLDRPSVRDRLLDSTASVIVGKASESLDDPTILTVTISRTN